MRSSKATPPAIDVNRTTNLIINSNDRTIPLSPNTPSHNIPLSSSPSSNNQTSNHSSSLSSSQSLSATTILPRGTNSSSYKPNNIETTIINNNEAIAKATTTTNYIQTAIDFQPYDYTQEDEQTSISTSNRQTANMTQNYRENVESGDTFHIKDENTTRFYFQNIRGCKKGNSWKDWQYATKYLHDNQVDIIGYAETNLYSVLGR